MASPPTTTGMTPNHTTLLASLPLSSYRYLNLPNSGYIAGFSEYRVSNTPGMVTGTGTGMTATTRTREWREEEGDADRLDMVYQYHYDIFELIGNQTSKVDRRFCNWILKW
jgi:hypothetical protein